LTPGEGDTYYLVVPTHADREGSYGRDSAENERTPSSLPASPCVPQQAGACGP